MGIASLPVIAGGFPQVAPEPISPELVLVDPELRRALQARVVERPPLQLVRDELTALRVPVLQPVPPPPPMPLPLSLALERVKDSSPRARRARGWVRRRLVPILLPMSLALNAALIASAVSDSTASQPARTPPAVGTGASKRSAHPPRSVRRSGGRQKIAAPAPPARVSALHVRSARVERKLLNLVVQSPAGRLPQALIDSKTGLAKNNLQAVCRRESGSRSFLCVVRPARHKPDEGAYVRYRLNRSGTGGTFTWFRYRSG
jgi:hypothetical protein